MKKHCLGAGMRRLGHAKIKIIVFFTITSQLQPYLAGCRRNSK
jgi:hypothetical protein